MDYCRRKIEVFICMLLFTASAVYATSKDLYNLLVDDLLNSCFYGYKGTNLETGEIEFGSYLNTESYIMTGSENNFYIQSEKGFFKVKSNRNEILYTRNGDFIKRGNDYYLSYGDYKLETEIKDCSNNPDNKVTLIFHPGKSSKVIRKGCFYYFSEVDSFEEEIICNRLELPNIDPIKILLRMKTILNQFSEDYSIQLEIIDRMLDVLVEDKMHEYYIRRSYSQFDLEKYELINNQITLDQLKFIYSTNWARSFRCYIEMLRIQ